MFCLVVLIMLMMIIFITVVMKAEAHRRDGLDDCLYQHIRQRAVDSISNALIIGFSGLMSFGHYAGE